MNPAGSVENASEEREVATPRQTPLLGSLFCHFEQGGAGGGGVEVADGCSKWSGVLQVPSVDDPPTLLNSQINVIGLPPVSFSQQVPRSGISNVRLHGEFSSGQTPVLTPLSKHITPGPGAFG
jgi:hypothetical protein